MSSKLLYIIFVCIIVFISGKYYLLNKKYNRTLIENESNLSKLAFEKANVVILQQAIDKQNIKLKQYQESFDEFSKKIEKLNKEIEMYNNTSEQEIKMDAKNENSSEEAIEWLKVNSINLIQ